MSKRIPAPRVKAAIAEIISNRGREAITVEVIAQKLRDEYADAIKADMEDLLNFGLGVAIKGMSSRPIQDPESRDLFGASRTHEFIKLRGRSGGKLHIDYVTPRLLLNQPSRPPKRDAESSQEEMLVEAAKEMQAKGLLDESVIAYLKRKKR